MDEPVTTPVRDTESGQKYWAFISYSHRDSVWAVRLHKFLETYRVPKKLIGRTTHNEKIPRRLFPVFRDRDELPTSADLGGAIASALDRSRCLVVVCSPHSARSRWVNEEVRRFKVSGRENRVIGVVVDGEPNASDRPEGQDHECFMPALRYRVDGRGLTTDERVEPIAADVRPGADGQRNAFLKITAGILGVGFDELRQRDKSRRQRRALTCVLLSVVVLAALGFGWVSQQAKEQRLKETHRLESLLESGRNHYTQGDTRQALTDLIKASSLAAQLKADPPALRFLLGRCLGEIHSCVRDPNGSTTHAQWTDDGRLAITVSNYDTLRVWDLDLGKLKWEYQHDSPLSDIAVSHDKKTVAIACVGSLETDTPFSILLLDLDSGRKALEAPRDRFKNVTSGIKEIVYLQNDGFLLSVHADGTRVVWTLPLLDSTSVRFQRGSHPHVNPQVRSSPDGSRTLVWDEESHSAELLDERGTGLAILQSPQGVLSDAAFSADGRALVTAGHGLQIWDAGSGGLIRHVLTPAETPDSKDRIEKVNWLDENHVVVTTRYNDLQVRDIATGKITEESQTFDGMRVELLAVAPQSRRVVIGGDTANDTADSVLLWEIGGSSERHALVGHSAPLVEIGFSADGRHLLSAASDGSLVRRNVDKLPSTRRVPGESVVSAGWSSDRRIAATAGADNIFRAWDTGSGVQGFQTPEQTSPPLCVLVAPDGTRIYCANQEYRLSAWDFQGGKRVWEVQLDDTHESGGIEISGGLGFDSIALSPLSRHLVALGHDKLWVLDASTGRVLHTRPNPYSPAVVSFDPSGASVIVAGGAADNSASIYGLVSGDLKLVLEGEPLLLETEEERKARPQSRGHEGMIHAALYSPDSQRVLTTSEDATAKLWDASTGRVLHTMKGHSGAVTGGAFSPDGRWVATLGQDLSCRVWQARDGKPVAVLEPGEYPMKFVEFSTDGSLIVTGDSFGESLVFAGSGRINCWETRTGKLLASFAVKGEVRGMCFVGGGTGIVAISEGGVLYRWNIEREKRPLEAVVDLGKKLVGELPYSQ